MTGAVNKAAVLAVALDALPVPHSRHSPAAIRTPQKGGNASLPICPAVMPKLEKRTFTHRHPGLRQGGGSGSCRLADREAQARQVQLAVLAVAPRDIARHEQWGDGAQ